MKYTKTPIEAGQVDRLSLRTPNKINVRFNTFPVKGRKYRLYLKCKKHMEEQIEWLTVLSTDELYRVKLAIAQELVPEIFKDTVNSFYDLRRKGMFVTEIIVGNGEVFPVFEYENEKLFLGYELPKTQPKPVDVFKPKAKQIPIKLPQSVIAQLKRMKK